MEARKGNVRGSDVLANPELGNCAKCNKDVEVLYGRLVNHTRTIKLENSTVEVHCSGSGWSPHVIRGGNE